jgi:hypothetical protein
MGGSRCLVAVALVFAGLLATPVAQDVPIEELLVRLGGYVETFERELATVVSEEIYEQTVAPQHPFPPEQRRLKSEVLLTRTGELGWVVFRDVIEVDGTPLTGRADRLLQLFLKPSGDVAAQVLRIVEESAKYNLGWIRRTVNVPTMVLQFAKRNEQARSQFRRGATAQVGGTAAREIRFSERSMPRMIRTPDAAAASGSFWVEEATGRVLKTELKVNTGSTTTVIGVSYGYQPKLDLWLPVLMSERYTTPRQPVISGRAIYSNFRRFDVQVATIIK